MDHENYLFMFSAIIIAVVILILILFYKSHQKEKIKIAELKDEYDGALRKGNKADALKKGREYYAALRGGILSIYDEQAIQNDLSTMNI